jgi:hypothetical protein
MGKTVTEGGPSFVDGEPAAGVDALEIVAALDRLAAVI